MHTKAGPLCAHRTFHLFFSFLILLLVIGFPEQGQCLAAAKPARKPAAAPAAKPAPAAPDPAKDTPQARDERFYRALTKGWSLFYGGKLAEAAQAVSPLADSEVEWARVEAQHLQARCYWAAGSEYRGRANLVWKKLQTQSTLNANLIRLEIAKSLPLQALQKPAESAALLEAALQRQVPGTCSPEAAIELGRSHVAQKQWDPAKKAFDFAVAYSQSQAKTNKEIPGYVYDPFIAEARRALDHLKFDRDEGRQEFEQAEKLRAAKKYADAGKAYQAVAKKYPQSSYAAPSELHLGHCMLGLGQPAQAVAHWQKFIAAAPSGPWRGQAYTEIINLCLQEVFDLENAARFAQLAQNSQAAAMQDPASAGTWQAGLFDLQLALGMVAFVRGDTAAAADAFSKAAPAAPKNVKNVKSSFPALVATAKEGKPLLPADVTSAEDAAPSTDNPPSSVNRQSSIVNRQSGVMLALAMGRIYRITGEADDSRRMFALAISGKLGRPSAAQFAYAKFAIGDDLDAGNKHAEARDQYVESVRAWPRGSWQDETLFRIANYIQSQAERKYAAPVPPAGPANPPDPNSKAERDRQSAERDRLKNLTAASADALEYWALLVQHFPRSPHREAALFQAAKIFADTQKWPDAVAMADKLAAEFPASKSAPKLLYEIGTALAALQRWDDAVKIADRLASAYPKEPFAPKLLYEVASALLKIGKFKDATDLAEKMIAACPQDPNGPKLFYDLGVILYDMAEKGDPAKTEALWKNAEAMLKRFCELAPKGQWAGWAYVRLTDLALERMFDLNQATVSAVAGANWANQSGGQRDSREGALASPQADKSDGDIQYELYLRAGMTALLGQNYQKAVEYLTLAHPQSSSPMLIPTKNLNAIGVSFLLEAATQRRSFTKEQALAATTTDQQKTLILLADMYLWGLRAQKARSLYERLLAREPVLGRVTPDLEAYAIFEIAATYNCERTGYGTALQWLARLNDAKYKKTYWQAYAKFRTALYTVNKTGDLRKSFDLYQAIIDEYPDHPITELAYAYYCMNACVLRDRERAAKASNAFFSKYPNSKWKAPIEQRLQELGKEKHQ